MTIEESIQKAIDLGRGEEAKVLGKPFNVFRQNTLIYTNFPVRVAGRFSDRNFSEMAVSLRNVILMELVFDATNILPGDVFQGDDPSDRYVLAAKRNQFPLISFRTETKITLRRPVQPTQVTSPNTYIQPYAGRKDATDYILTYDSVANTYSFAAPGATEAFIYAGKSQLNYTGSITPEKLPLDTRVTRWVFCLEILPGLKIQESDYILFDSDYYQIYSVDKQVAGFNGQVLNCDLVRP